MSRRHEPEPVATIDDTAATQHQQVVEAAAIAWAAQRTVEALAAGMPVTSARRWPRYLAMKRAKGQVPISLQDAVGQKLVALAVARARTPRLVGEHGPEMFGPPTGRVRRT